MTERYAKLFVDTRRSRADIAHIVAAHMDGAVVAPYTIVCPLLELDVRENTATAPNSEEATDFLYFPVLIEAYGVGRESSDAAFIDGIAAVMMRLHADGASVVAACDWEERLPGGGRLAQPIG